MSIHPADVAHAAAANGTGQRTPIIDCDLHHQYGDVAALFPYLPRHYVEYIQDFGPMLPGIGYTNMPGSGARHDLWVGVEENPATLPRVAIERHLDVYDIDIAVLTGGPYAAAVHPDVDYAGAFNLGGDYHARLNYCPHRAGPLCHGRVRPLVVADGLHGLRHEREDEILKCPWHQWEFDIRAGRALYDDALRVRTYAVKEEGGEVVVYV